MDGASTTPEGEARDAGVTPAEVTPPEATPGEVTPAQVEAVGVTTPAETTTAEATPAETGGVGAADNGSDLDKVRELVLKANPDVVPELVRGGSIDELLAAVVPARSAYQRVAEAVRAGGRTTEARDGGTADAARPPAVPAGGATNVVDPSTLAPTTKIAQGLRARG